MSGECPYGAGDHRELIRQAKVEALRDAADDWRNEGRGVMFNRAGDDLSPEGRVGKWLWDRATLTETGTVR